MPGPPACGAAAPAAPLCCPPEALAAPAASAASTALITRRAPAPVSVAIVFTLIGLRMAARLGLTNALEFLVAASARMARDARGDLHNKLNAARICCSAGLLHTVVVGSTGAAVTLAALAVRCHRVKLAAIAVSCQGETRTALLRIPAKLAPCSRGSVTLSATAR